MSAKEILDIISKIWCNTEDLMKLSGLGYVKASYLKKDGTFIFSWSHPIHKCVTVEDDTLVFRKCYFDESWYSVPMDGGVFSLSDRKMSTYINALAKAGFMIEEMLEDPYRGGLPPKYENSEKTEKWQMVPSVFVIKARKL